MGYPRGPHHGRYGHEGAAEPDDVARRVARHQLEMAVRHICAELGARYRLYREGLPGTPDLVFVSRGLILLVHCCFWHRNAGCGLTTPPKICPTFWRAKF
jgi:DNA mismatch endonuclease Vsr